MGNQHQQVKKLHRSVRESDRGVPHVSFKPLKLKRGQYPRRPDEESITSKVDRLKLLSADF